MTDMLTKRVISDDPDENADVEEMAELQQQQALQAEKTVEQLQEEAHREWKRFFYAPWGGKMFWFLLVLGVINMVLTLDQWHGTHGWRLPMDYLPRDRRYGGWPQLNHSLRFAGGIIGALGSCFSWVLSPSADKYKCLFFMLFTAGVLLSCGFGFDTMELHAAQGLSICKKSNSIPDMKTHRYICQFEDYIATVIIEFICCVLNFATGIYLCRLAMTGAVSRKQIFNEQSGQWEKYIATGDENPLNRFPRRYRNQLGFQNFILFVGAILNCSLIGLSVTQSTGIFVQSGTDYSSPVYNTFTETPVTVYVVHGDEAVRFGSWPEMNFLLRLSTGALAIIVTSFAVQWRRDGRSTQLIVIGLMLAAGALYLIAFAHDYIQWVDAKDNGCQWMAANNLLCVQRRYTAVVVIDAFLGFLFLIFAFGSLISFAKQARNPGNPWATPEQIKERQENPIHPYGWWCFGEWEAKQKLRSELGE